MHRWRLVAGTAAVLFTLVGCSDQQAGVTPTAEPTSTTPSSATATTPEPSKPTEPSSAPETTEATETPAPASKLVLTVGGTKTTIKPTDVYCSGSNGRIRHIIGKTDNRPPLVKAEGTHFVMVKLGPSQPYRSENPKGVDYGKDRVTFTGTKLSGATLKGTMICTTWND